MALFGILLLLYSLASWVWPLMGQQMVLLLWMQQISPPCQWSVRVALAGLGSTLLVVAWRRRRS